MAIRKLPEGTRGTRTPPRFLSKAMTGLMVRIHRRGGDRFNGMDLLYLTTVGARSGQRRTTPMARFDDGAGGWFVVASANGAARHPGWYHNVAAHPDQVWAEVSGTSRRVEVEQVEGEARDRAWATVTESAPNFKAYETKTDRELPILRLTPVGS
jgi:deazaflavin-dependent oxidoreductase (nitroreductase family)